MTATARATASAVPDPTPLDAHRRAEWFRALAPDWRQRFETEARTHLARLEVADPTPEQVETAATAAACHAWWAKHHPEPAPRPPEAQPPRVRAPLAYHPDALPVPAELPAELRGLMERARGGVVSADASERMDAAERARWEAMGAGPEIDLVQQSREVCRERGGVLLRVIAPVRATAEGIRATPEVVRIHVGALGRNTAWVHAYATARAYVEWLDVGNHGDPTDWKHRGREDRHYDHAERAAGAAAER